MQLPYCGPVESRGAPRLAGNPARPLREGAQRAKRTKPTPCLDPVISPIPRTSGACPTEPEAEDVLFDRESKRRAP
jgi:hypothetical protein